VSHYTVPLDRQVELIFHWKDMLDEAGMDYAGAPAGWNEYWKWWGDAQKEYRAKTGEDVFGVGWPMSTGAGDTNHFVEQPLLAHEGDILDDNLQLKSSKQIRGPITASVKFISDLYISGLSPKTSVTWDN